MSGDPDDNETETVRRRSHQTYLGYLKPALHCVHEPSLNEHR